MSSFLRKRQILLQGKTIKLSFLLFLIVFLFSSAAFVILMGRIMINNAGYELIKTVELERLKLEAYVKSEIAIALKMADSPLINKFFNNTDNIELKNMAFEEFASYRRAFTVDSVFWVNDHDKIFYSDDFSPYIIDPDNPENYWYNMTLYETNVYNFNINYNPDLNITNLWINAPVFNDDGKAIGIVGTGIYLSEFINSINRNFSGSAKIYLFNSAGEITGANDITLVVNKVNIEDELSHVKSGIRSALKDLHGDEIKYFKTLGKSGVVVLGAIPALDWYIIAYKRIGIIESLNTGLTFLFIALMFVVLSVFVVHETKLAKARAEAAKDAVISGIEYASIIQKNLLPDDSVFQKTFSDYSVTWKPRDIVSGDIYWIKKFKEGTVLCVCDCTGHGTPGALLTMLVVSALEAFVTDANCGDTANTIWELDKRLAAVLYAKKSDSEPRFLNIKDGCDIAVLFISNNGNVTSSSGNINIFICNGENVTRIRGQKLYVGEGNLKSKDDIKTEYIPLNKNNKFYIASDGLFEQPGGKDSILFGFKRFMKIIMEHHNESQSVISKKIWEIFEDYCGGHSRVDDFELISFKID